METFVFHSGFVYVMLLFSEAIQMAAVVKAEKL